MENLLPREELPVLKGARESAVSGLNARGNYLLRWGEAVIDPQDLTPAGKIRRRRRIGGLLVYYYREAA